MIKTAVLTTLLAASAAGFTQPPADAPAPTRLGPNEDPNQIVCQTENEIGSRVARRRVCRTRAEWAEHRRMYRQSVERAQNQMQTDSRSPVRMPGPGRD